MPYSTSRVLRPMFGPVLFILSFTVVAQTDPVSHAIQKLQNGDPDVRRSAVTELSRLADARAVEPLIGVLNDNDPSVSYLAAQALGIIGDTRAVEPLISALRDKNFSVRSAAIKSLGQIKDPRAFEPLSILLRDHEAGLQKAAQDALIEMGPTVVEPLCHMLQGEDHSLRFYAADLLTKIHDPRAINSLISSLGVRVNGIGQLAADGLVGIGVPAVDELIVSLSDADPIVRQLAVKALGQIKDARAFDSLLDALDDESVDVRRQALVAVMNFEGDRATEAAVRALHDDGLRVEASLLLGERKDLRAIPYLIEILKVSDPLNGDRAQRALILIGKPGVEELIEIVRDPNPEYPMREVRQRLELSKLQFDFRCGNEPPPPILDPRRSAAIALGEIGDERAITSLTEALKDESPGLRADAANALAKMAATKVGP
jgi:HEAT repeat protein